jgi:hypothetical protein
VGERGLAAAVGVCQQKPGLEKYLKPVADSEDEAATVMESPKHVTQSGSQFESKDAAAGDVVAIRKAARDAEDLEVVGHGRPFGEGPNMHATGESARLLEREGGFVIAVGTRSTQDQRARSEHSAGLLGE